MNIFTRGFLILLILVMLWQLLVSLTQLPPYLLPGPWAVAQVFYTQGGLLIAQAKITCIETLLGFILGVGFGTLAALILAQWRWLNLWILPILLISQAIPTFVIAPLLVVWLGYGIASKIFTAAIVIFFPVTNNFLDGLNQLPKVYKNLASVMQGSRARILWHLRIPYALPSLASGLKIAAVFAPMSAVVGEWVGSSEGLGHLMLNANARMQIDLMFAALMMIILLTLLCYALVGFGTQRLK